MSWFADSELAAISYLAGPGAGLLVNDVYSYGENITYIHICMHAHDNGYHLCWSKKESLAVTEAKVALFFFIINGELPGSKLI